MSRLLSRLASRARAEEGWVVVTAIVLMTIMVGTGLAVLATADTQSQQSRHERVRESSFNLAEGLMQAESVVLQNNWPSLPPCAGNAVGCGYQWAAGTPDTCTEATSAANPNQCPDPAKLVGASGAFSNVDQVKAGGTWKISVRDDLGVCLSNPPAGYSAFYDTCQIPTYYRDQCPPPNQADATKCWPAISGAKYSTSPGQAPGADQLACRNAANASVACTWDANGNKQVWVRVDAKVGGKTRSLVALLHLESFPVNLSSKDAVSGGAVNFTNTGNKFVVDAGTSRIVARCLPSTGATPGTGVSLSTTIVNAIATGNTTDTVTVPNGTVLGPGGIEEKFVMALGVDKDAPPYELLTVKAVDTGAKTIQFTTNILQQHPAGEKLELAPAALNAKPPNNCESWSSPNAPGETGADKHQLDAYYRYKSDPNYPNFVDHSLVDGIVAGVPTYDATTGCPTSWNGNLYIKVAPAAGCTVPNGTVNSSSAPHFIIVRDQTGGCANPALRLSGNTVFYGLIYMMNEQGCTYSQPIVQIAAGAQVEGGVVVDGNGKVEIGQASNSSNCAVQGGASPNFTCPTVKFNEVAFGSIAASGAAGLVQNTWRELAPGQ